MQLNGRFSFQPTIDVSRGLLVLKHLPAEAGDLDGALRMLSGDGPPIDVAITLRHHHRQGLSSRFPFAIALNGLSPSIYELSLFDSVFGWSEILSLQDIPSPRVTFCPRFMIESRLIDDDGVLRTSGVVTNAGVMDWAISADCSLSPIRVAVRIICERSGAILKETRTTLLKGTVAIGESCPFSCAIDLAMLPPDTPLLLDVDLVRENVCWASQEYPAFRAPLTLPAGLLGQRREMRLALMHASPIGSLGLLCDYTLRNDGSLPISAGDDGERPFLVKVMAGQHEQESIWAGTARLPVTHLSCGAAINIQTEVILDLNVFDHDLTLKALPECAGAFAIREASSDRISIAPSLPPVETITPFIPRLRTSAPTVVFVSLGAPQPDRDTNSVRLVTIFEELVDLGAEVHFLVPTSAALRSERLALRRLRDWGVTVYEWPLTYLATAQLSPDPVIVFSYYISSQVYWESVRRTYPTARTIVDSVDIHWVRRLRGIESGMSALPAFEYLEGVHQERKAYERADEVWVVSSDDARELRASGISTPTTILPLAYHDRGASSEPSNQTVLFIGNFLNEPNIDAALTIHRIISTMRHRRTWAPTVRIVGPAFPGYLRDQLENEWFEIAGHIPRLEDAYDGCSVLFAPLRFGAGVKGKILEAISFGLSVVTSEIGNEGIGLRHLEEAFICDSDAEYEAGLTQLLSSPELRREMVDRAKSRILPRFSREHLRLSLERSLFNRGAPAV